jgi:hypothetical protein
MCVAIPTLFPELSTLASKTESSLKDSMNHFVELASAQELPEKQLPPVEHNPDNCSALENWLCLRVHPDEYPTVLPTN